MSSSRGLSCLARAGVCLVVGFGLGCVENAIHAENRAGDYTAYDIPEAVPPTEGGVYRGGGEAGSFLFFDRKARGVGDLVTVLVLENVSAEGTADTRLRNSSQTSANASSDIGFTDLLQGGAKFLFGLAGARSSASRAAGESVNVLEAQRGNEFEGDGSTGRSGRFNAIVTCRVVEVLPGGLFHILGRRSILVNHEEQVLSVEGLVRREDISIDNTVVSTALAEAKLAFDGRGVIDDKQRPSVVSRVMDWIIPF